MEAQLRGALEAERTERIAADEALKREVYGRVDQVHATLESVRAMVSDVATNVAVLTGKLTGSRVTAMELLKGAGWVVTAALLAKEAFNHH